MTTGNKYWGRIAGTSYEAMVHDWAEAKFKKYGLEDIHRQPFTLPTQWFPDRLGLHLHRRRASPTPSSR